MPKNNSTVRRNQRREKAATNMERREKSLRQEGYNHAAEFVYRERVRLEGIIADNTRYGW